MRLTAADKRFLRAMKVTLPEDEAPVAAATAAAENAAREFAEQQLRIAEHRSQTLNAVRRWLRGEEI